MDTSRLEATAKAMTAPGKGILAADESTGTIKKRFDTIGVESTPGQGSCFWFCIEARAVPENAQVPTQHGAELPSLVGQTVLVALDNRVSADAAAYYLERCGADVSVGADGNPR